MKKIVYVGFAFKHHQNTQAGYHHIKDYLLYDYVFDTQWEFDLLSQIQTVWYKKILAFLLKNTLGVGCPLTILRCIFFSLFYRNVVFHFIYAEGNYKWLHHFLGKTNQIVCSFHQPADILEHKYGWRRDLPNINKVILLSEKDRELFKQWTGKSNVKFIPHGINIDFYSPSSEVKKERIILMVGNWLRNFDFANQVFNDLLEQDDFLQVYVVTNEVNFSYFQKHDRLFLETNITDWKLRDLYRRSYLVFLPLYSYTANNAIMEAAATGCQIVIATNREDPSYFSHDRLDILPLQKDLVERFLIKKLDEPYSDQRVLDNRNFVVQNYSWQHVADLTRKYLLE